jgi:hypothetical protein
VASEGGREEGKEKRRVREKCKRRRRRSVVTTYMKVTAVASLCPCASFFSEIFLHIFLKTTIIPF